MNIKYEWEGDKRKCLRNAKKYVNITRKKICKASLILVSITGLKIVVVTSDILLLPPRRILQTELKLVFGTHVQGVGQ